MKKKQKKIKISVEQLEEPMSHISFISNFTHFEFQNTSVEEYRTCLGHVTRSSQALNGKLLLPGNARAANALVPGQIKLLFSTPSKGHSK